MGSQSLFMNHLSLPKPPLINAITTNSPPLPDPDHYSPSPLPGHPRHHHLFLPQPKGKVVFVMGATGTGKSRLSIDLATRFRGEVVNSDKIQLYEGLPITTNKVTDEERAGVPHHLLGVVDPFVDFSSSDFRRCATETVEAVLTQGRLPIVAGGSNSYIEALVDGEGMGFRSRYECCFLWLDVALPVLCSFLEERVDRMVEAGMVDEVRQVFDPKTTDYSHGIRRAIGVPELDRFFRAEAAADASGGGARQPHSAAIDIIKANTCELARRQLEKIRRLRGLPGWRMHRVNATEYFLRRRGESEATEQTWEGAVVGPSMAVVRRFISDIAGDSAESNRRGKESMVATTAAAGLAAQYCGR